VQPENVLNISTITCSLLKQVLCRVNLVHAISTPQI
jgi:hypothetical protein